MDVPSAEAPTFAGMTAVVHTSIVGEGRGEGKSALRTFAYSLYLNGGNT